jgi:hypothetical protein
MARISLNCSCGWTFWGKKIQKRGKIYEEGERRVNCGRVSKPRARRARAGVKKVDSLFLRRRSFVRTVLLNLKRDQGNPDEVY